MAEVSQQWWYLELVADFPELEIYTGPGWGPAQELAEIELGGRVTMEEALWLPTWFYSKPRDRHWAAVSCMFAMIIKRIRRDKGLKDDEPVERADIPPGWMPDVQAWDDGRL